jgi:hypothetical protein
MNSWPKAVIGWPTRALPHVLLAHAYEGFGPRRIQAQIRRRLASLAGP